MQGLRDEMPKSVGAKLIGRGSISGKLYDLGRYPGAKAGTQPSDRVHGEVHRLPNADAAFDVLDRYEGLAPGAPGKSEFVRSLVNVTMEDSSGERGWAYLYNRPVNEARLIPSGDYRERLASESGNSKEDDDMTFDEMQQSMKDLRDNQVVQGQLLHRVETNLDRLEEKVERLADGFILLQSAMKGLVQTVDRFIRGMEHNGHHPSGEGPEGVQ